jgi:hypothetical protein
MAGEPVYLDVTDLPELARAAEEVRTTNKPRVLRRGTDEIAVLMPLRKRRGGRAISREDYEAFLASAGSWKGIVDVEQFKRDNARQKRIPGRRPVEL